MQKKTMKNVFQLRLSEYFANIITQIIHKYSNFFQNCYLKEVRRRALLSIVMISKFSERCFVNGKRYLTWAN